MSMNDFLGKWNFVDSDNFDAYLKQVGVGLVTRKVAANLKPQLVFEEEGGKYKMHSYSTFKNITVEFELDKDFDEVTGDGRKVVSKFFFENGKLVQTQKGDKDSTFHRYIEGGKLIIEMECENVKAKRTYQKAE